MATIKRYTYEFDPTGRLEANLIRNELHTITPENRTPQNVLFPGFAPFFRQSLIVTDILTGRPLLEGIDYTCEYPAIPNADNLEGYTPIYGGIQFIDNAITGQFSLQYQTIGGQFALDGVAIAQALANQASDPLTSTYDDVIGKPLKLPPLEHVHSINDFVGFEDLCREVNLLKEAILLLAKEDRDSHPGYDSLIDSYFRLEELMQENKSGLTALSEKTDRDLSALRDNITTLINQTKSALEQRINALETNTDRKIRETKEALELAISNLNNSLTQLITALTTRLNNFIQGDTRVTHEWLNRGPEAKNGFFSGAYTMTGGQLGTFPYHSNTGAPDFVGLNLATPNGDVGQITQFISFGYGQHYIRSKDGSTDTWKNEAIITNNNLNKALTESNHVVLLSTNQTINGNKTFNGVTTVNNDLVIGKTNSTTKGTVKVNGNFIDIVSTNPVTTGPSSYNVRIPANVLNTNTQHFLTTLGTAFVGMGNYNTQLTTTAPYLVERNSNDNVNPTTERRANNGYLGYLPILKARFSNVANNGDRDTLISSYTLGVVPSGNTSTLSKGSFSLLYVNSAQTDNTFGDNMVAWHFKVNNGAIESTQGRYELYSNSATDIMRLTYKGKNRDVSRYLDLYGTGEVKTHLGTVTHSTANHILAPVVPGTTGTSGVRFNLDGQMYYLEVRNDTKVLRFIRNSKPGATVGANNIEINFPNKTGTVALTSDVDALRTTLADGYVTLNTEQTIAANKIFSPESSLYFSSKEYRVYKGNNNEFIIDVTRTGKGNASLRLNAETAGQEYLWTNVKSLRFQNTAKIWNNELYLGSENKCRIGRNGEGAIIQAVNTEQNAYIRVRDDGIFDFRAGNVDANTGGGIRLGGDNKALIKKDVQDTRTVISMGDVSVNDIYIRSDRRLKENIQTIQNPLDVVLKLTGKTFDWKGSGRHAAGFIAQEVEQVCDELVSRSADGTMSVNYVDVIAYLTEAIKEQQKQIDELKSKLNQ